MTAENIHNKAEHEVDYAPEKINGSFEGKHIVSVDQLSSKDLNDLHNLTYQYKKRSIEEDLTLLDIAKGKIIIELFYEASSRTDLSFQIAMQRIGGGESHPSGGVRFSSFQKGEDLADTVRMAGCYADVIILRHKDEGSSFLAASYLDKLRKNLPHRNPVLISGGDGISEHPTQAFLDDFTIKDQKGGLWGLKIFIVGDLHNGRTAHSLGKQIAANGYSDTEITLVSPPSLRMPTEIVDRMNNARMSVRETSDILSVIGEADVIYWTRIQEERFQNKDEYEAIKNSFIMTPKLLAMAKTDAILMHPFPRKHEMGTQSDHDILDDDPRSVYFQQMENGMYVRMALLALVLGKA